jgi:hypothetical protein
MTAQALEKRLATGRPVVLTADEWATLAGAFEEVERHDTMMAGPLLVIRTSLGLAAVEQPKKSERVVRVLGDPGTARRFVEDRMALYERMWDGCGCRVEYYA